MGPEGLSKPKSKTIQNNKSTGETKRSIPDNTTKSTNTSFIPATSFLGAKEGYQFQTGISGVGYYKSTKAATPTTVIIQLQKKLINQNKPPQQLHYHYHPPLLPLLLTILISVEPVHAKFTMSNRPAVLHVNLVAYLATEMHNKKQPLHLRPWLVTMLSSL